MKNECEIGNTVQHSWPEILGDVVSILVWTYFEINLVYKRGKKNKETISAL